MVTLTNHPYQNIKFQDSGGINPGHYPWLGQGREAVLGSVF